MKYKARRGLVAGEHMHPALPNRTIPPGLSDTVEVTIWNKHGDHPGVTKVPPFAHTDGTVVTTGGDGKAEIFKGQAPYVPMMADGKTPFPPNTRMFQMEMTDAVVRREDPETGKFIDHVVKPGYAIIENHSDGKTWALSPHHLKAWFEPAA